MQPLGLESESESESGIVNKPLVIEHQERSNFHHIYYEDLLSP